MLQLLCVLPLTCAFVRADALRLSALTRQSTHLHHVVEGSALAHLGDVSEHGVQSEAELHTARPNLSKIERTGWYAWPVVHNCRVISRSGNNTRVYVKPRDVPWPQLKNWTRLYKPNVLKSNDEVFDGLKWSVGLRLSFGGSVNGKGRFLKDIRLVAKATCTVNVNVKIAVTKVRSFISRKYTRQLGAAGPVAGVTLSLKADYMYKHLGRFTKARTCGYRLHAYGNGRVAFKEADRCR